MTATEALRILASERANQRRILDEATRALARVERAENKIKPLRFDSYVPPYWLTTPIEVPLD